MAPCFPAVTQLLSAGAGIPPTPGRPISACCALCPKWPGSLPPLPPPPGGSGQGAGGGVGHTAAGLRCSPGASSPKAAQMGSKRPACQGWSWAGPGWPPGCEPQRGPRKQRLLPGGADHAHRTLWRDRQALGLLRVPAPRPPLLQPRPPVPTRPLPPWQLCGGPLPWRHADPGSNPSSAASGFCDANESLPSGSLGRPHPGSRVAGSPPQRTGEALCIRLPSPSTPVGTLPSLSLSGGRKFCGDP